MARNFMQTAEKLKIIKNLASAGDQGSPESIDVYIIADWAAKRAGHKKNTKQAGGWFRARRQSMCVVPSMRGSR